MRRSLSFLTPARTGPLVLLALVAALPTADRAFAQRKQNAAAPSPKLFVLSPAGARAGTSVEVTLTGQDLDEPQRLLCDVPGVTAEYLAPAEAPADLKTAGRQRGGMQAGPLKSVRFKVTVPAGAPPGVHDLRFAGRHGVSNPRAFVIGDQPELLEKEPNNDVAEAQPVELNSSVHGTVAAPTDVDYFRFAGKKGQRVVVALLASGIDSRLPAAMELYHGGSLLAAGREYQGSDAVLDAVLPADDDYLVRVFAFTYTQGGPEYFYRLTVTTAPWIDAVFPPVVVPGKPSRVTVYGRNLPGGEPAPEALLDGRPLEKVVTTVSAPKGADALQKLAYPAHVAPPSAGLDGFALRLRNSAGLSNPYLLTYARAPVVVLDNGTNDTPEAAQEVPVPCEIAGRIEKKRDRDWYRFSAKKGEVYSIDVFGDRLGSPVDLYFTLARAGAKGNADEIDDNPEVLHPQQFFTRTDDPARYRLSVPEDGSYLLQVTSREADLLAGPRQLYVVRIAPEQPDFRLIVMPISLTDAEGVTLPRRGAGAVTVFAWRQDGFDGEIHLSAEGLPPGVKCPPQTLGAGQKQATLVFLADDGAEPWAGFVTLRGTATVGDAQLVREARAATLVWPVQQNQTAIARLARGLALAVGEPAPFALVPAKDTLTSPPGSRVTVPLKLTRQGDFKAAVQVTLTGYPQNFLAFNNNQPLNLTAADGTGTLDVRPNVPEGTYTLVFRAQANVQQPAEKGQPARNYTVAYVSAPLTLVVARPKLAKLDLAGVSVEPQNLRIKPGETQEVTVRVQRKKGDQTPLRVTLVQPANVDFLRGEDVTIAGDQDRAKFSIRASSSRSRPGSYDGVILRISVAGAGEKAAASDAKFRVTVQ